MATRLKIDLAQGLLEVEGSETFVKAIYKDFKIHFIGEEAGETLERPVRRRRKTSKEPEFSEDVQPQPAEESSSSIDELFPQPEIAPSPQKPNYTLLTELNLAAGENRASLVEFMDQKFPITNEERNLVFLYYLQYMLKTKPLTIDHIYTCYKAAKIRVPLNLESSLQITATQRRWIKITKTGRLSVGPPGKLYVEKQLPKKLKN